MKCLETRTTADGFKRRRYERPNKTRFTTIEVPLAVWNGINKQGRGAGRAEAWLRGQLRSQLRQRARAHRDAGWTARKTAYVMGIPIRTIQRWRK